ncbi:TetR/AcrR family transcriptional regulator [uncultured Paraglaciecola sp.]|uniref:TetR/AcrR family transcriptional regulator n=1 Tax=uncultured Paraglaciecola sp. TaxID=1765024 RepID=UPI002595FA08|nr:TetR/AcrR family transcriptional regulator [uncultured Paraglaciecola sp.]
MNTSKREINTAKNKQAILQCLLKRMHLEPFDVIKITDLCADSAVSHASFYNYFPQKVDILIYYIQLWTVETHWKITVKSKLTGLNAILQMYFDTADICAKQPQLMSEIIALQAKGTTTNSSKPLTVADKLIAYPDYAGIENIELANLRVLLSTNVSQAVFDKELPERSDVNGLVVAFSSVFFSVPIMFNGQPLSEIKSAYEQQFNLIKSGALALYSQP